LTWQSGLYEGQSHLRGKQGEEDEEGKGRGEEEGKQEARGGIREEKEQDR
jgi:hypothetical protein